MPTRKDDLTTQVDGSTDVFVTTYPYLPGTLMVGYNGQLYPVNRNIAEEIDSTHFRLDFVPEVQYTDALHVIYEDFSGSEEETSVMQASGLPPGACD